MKRNNKKCWHYQKINDIIVQNGDIDNQLSKSVWGDVEKDS